jgi:hypothetical protein
MIIVGYLLKENSSFSSPERHRDPAVDFGHLGRHSVT